MKPTLFFLDGAIIAPGRVALAAQYNEYADVDASRVLIKLEDGWEKVDFDDDTIRSLAFDASSGILYMLGISGIVYTIGGLGARFPKSPIAGTLMKQQVVDPEDRGELFRVRAVAGRVLACGLGGQLLDMVDGIWHSIGVTGSPLSCPDFLDVTVDAVGRPVAVGLNGAIYRFGNSGPEAIDSPTNQRLSSVVANSSGRCFACGNAGIVLVIDDVVVRDISVNHPAPRNLWAITDHAEALYVCEPDRLLRRRFGENVSWEIEHVSSSITPDFYRLASSGKQLWSFGADHVFVKQDADWTQVLIPGNEIAP